MMVRTPDKYFFAKGASEGITKLNSFDKAIINAGIGDTNLIRLSSIVPPSCREIEPVKLPGGALIPTAYASYTSENPGEIISASVAIGIPEDDSLPGLIMEYSAAREPEYVEKFARDMVTEGFLYRNRKLKDIKSVVVSIKVESIATVFAGIVLWY
ncbi:MAG: arginine decarboxylase, pyruvoyl-dependent [Candidatus Cloacimonetes bacterium]|nr:arginine decarboxylase, pyruvoyl-dependent [Candidatus Cloacimonadota bacterium]